MDLGSISRLVVALMLGLWRRARNRLSLELPTMRAHDLTTSYRIAAPAARQFDSIYFTVSCGSESPGFVPKLANRLTCLTFRGCSVLLGQCWYINNKKFWEELIAYVSWYDTDHIENNASNNSSIVACVFVAAETFLTSRCLATRGEYTQTHRLMGKIYEVRRWDGLRCHDIHTTFHKY
jgi:hypothetical protein